MFPTFQKNKLFTGEVTMEKLNRLADGASRGVSAVSGNITMTQGANGVALHVPPPPEKPGVAFAIGSTATAIGTGSTVLALDSVTNEYDGAMMIELATNTLTFKRAGWYLLKYDARIVYATSPGTDGATMKAAKVTISLKGGGTELVESKGVATLSSRQNLTKKVKIPDAAEDGIIFYHGTHDDQTAVPDSDEPTAWHGSATAQGTWTVWATEINPGSDLQLAGAPILTNMTQVASYSSILFDAQTASGQTLIQVVLDGSNGLKVKRGASLYAPTLAINGTAVFGGEGTVNPDVSCEGVTLSILRIN